LYSVFVLSLLFLIREIIIYMQQIVLAETINKYSIQKKGFRIVKSAKIVN
jgi:hypothetical protein